MKALSVSPTDAPDQGSSALSKLLPGILLSIGVAGLAELFAAMQARLLGRAWLEGLVLAILLGTAIRSTARPGPRFTPGIAFSAKVVLEIAIVLLGASVSTHVLLAQGFALLSAIVIVVLVAIGCGFGIGRFLGLSPKLSMLVACGNAICGNSAIAAVAPLIRADAKDVAASVAFTAVLGVVVVLVLPAVSLLLGLSNSQFGVFAGLTVYAVPQVIAATAPVSALSVQLGTLVKLVRVLMLGPVLFLVSFYGKHLQADTTTADAAKDKPGRPAFWQLLPWFIVGFMLLMTLRSTQILPEHWAEPIHRVSDLLTVVAMAALGLGVDVRSVARAGARVSAAAAGALCVLAALSFLAIHWLGLH